MTMRVMLVTHGYPPFGTAGVERLSEHTALALTRFGHEVTVFTRRPSSAPPEPRLQRASRAGVGIQLVCGGGRFHDQFPRFDARLERIFERCLLEVMPDVVLVSHLMNHSPGYIAIAHRWEIPVIVELHDFYFACDRAHLQRSNGDLCSGPEGGRACARHCFAGQQRSLERWSLRTHAYRRALDEADAAVCPSQFVASYFERYGMAEAPRVIGNGVDVGAGSALARNRDRDGPLQLASLGVVTPHKGFHVALEALRLAGLKGTQYTIFGVPTEPYLGSLRRAAEAVPGLQFRCYGGFEPSEVSFLLGGIDAVIIPSLVWETYSTVAREALACGIPVVASRLGALPEAVREHENGLLFDPTRPGDLADILVRLAGDRTHLKALRAGIRPTDWTTVEQRTRGLEALLHEVCQRGESVQRRSRERAERTELVALRDALDM